MILPIEKIKAFSECPRYYRFLEENESPPIPFRHTVIESIIKKAHLQAIETGYRMDWKKILGLVDSNVFADVDITNAEKFELAKKLAEHILESIKKWYTELYMTCNVETYVDIPLKEALNRQTIEGVIPLIQLGGEVPVITTISDLGLTNLKLYNDLLVRGMAWLVQKKLECEAVKCIGLGIGPRGALDIVSVYINKGDYLRTESILYQLAGLMASGVNYPSVTEKCDSCVFSGRCKL